LTICASTLPVGSILSVNLGLYTHVGLVTGHDHRGLPLITSNSLRRGGVFQESFEAFCEGRPCKLVAAAGHDALLLVQRARSAIGSSYDLLRFNCEHFIEWVRGNSPTSGQVAFWGAVAIVAGICVAAATAG
jgi:HRAS-like suppressor 3